MKTCGRCGVDKSESEFGVNNATSDGLQGYCRDCMREYSRQHAKKKPVGWARKTADMTAYMRQYREDHPEYYREKDRKKHERQMKKLHGTDYVVGDPANKKKQSVERAEFARKRRKAKHAVKSAIRNGSLVRLPCWCCGAENVEGHHPDYSAPLDVVWLCRAHHLQLHKEHRENTL